MPICTQYLEFDSFYRAEIYGQPCSFKVYVDRNLESWDKKRKLVSLDMTFNYKRETIFLHVHNIQLTPQEYNPMLSSKWSLTPISGEKKIFSSFHIYVSRAFSWNKNSFNCSTKSDDIRQNINFSIKSCLTRKIPHFEKSKCSHL